MISGIQCNEAKILSMACVPGVGSKTINDKQNDSDSDSCGLEIEGIPSNLFKKP